MSQTTENSDPQGQSGDVIDYAGRSARQPARPLNQSAAVGFVWLFGQTIVTKAAGLLGQIGLAWLLSPDDFGLVTRAYTVTILAGMITNPGLDEVLVQRAGRLKVWANAAFWLSLATGLCGGLLMLAAAPVAMHYYGDREILGLIAVLALNSPIAAMALAPVAMHKAKMRFGLLAANGSCFAITAQVLAVLLAWAGFGAYSFILPFLLCNLVQTPLLAWLAGFRPRRSPQWRRWRFLLGGASLRFTSRSMLTLVAQGDYIVLGGLATREALGVYYFAYNFSNQTLRLLAYNLLGVLFPTLAQMSGDPRRQQAAAIRGIRTLSLIIVPFCLLQAVLAGPLIRLLFEAKWDGAILLTQLICVSAMFSGPMAPAMSLAMAQRRFRADATMCAISAAIFFACIIPLTLVHGSVGTASGLLLHTMIVQVIGFRFYLGREEGWTASLRHCGRAMAAGVAVFALAWLATQRVPVSTGNDLLQLLLVPALTLPLYALAMRRLDGETWRYVVERARGVLRRR